MPTGYTAIIDDNPDVTFKEYAWRCARAFGALVLLRDDTGARRDALTKAEAKLGELKTMTLQQAKALCEAEHQHRCQEIEKGNKREAEITRRYEAMAAAVRGWTPPSPDHEGLKEFMLEQLDTGRPSYAREPTELPKPPTAEVWLGKQLASVAKDVEYYRKRWQEEQEWTASRNEWLADLRKSLGNPNE